MFFFVLDAPHLTKWFTREERLTILSRKRHDHAGKERRQWDASQVLEAFIDPKTYLFFLFGLTANIPNVSCVWMDEGWVDAYGVFVGRHVELWHAHCQGLRVQHTQHDADANSLRRHHRPFVSCISLRA